MSVIIAFRTHIWNDDIEYMARRLKGSFSKADFVILADESREILDVGDFPKIGHTSDFSEFNIPNIPGQKTLWYNADYPLYALRKALPNYNHYIMIENDVLININLDPLITSLEKKQTDLIAHNILSIPDHWVFKDTITPYFKNSKYCFLPVLALSARAIDHLLMKKQEISYLYNNDNSIIWPYCEGFIPSAVFEMENPIVEELRNFCKLQPYDFCSGYYYLDPYVNIHGTICHPVKGKDFVERCITHDGINPIFNPRSSLRRGLKNLKPSDFYQYIHDTIKKTGNVGFYQQFNEIALQERWIKKPEAVNWALGGKASQSSVCAFSKFNDIYKDAAGAVNGRIGPDYNFHTATEYNPWWKLELPRTINIKHIIIYNRLNFEDRASKIKVEVSDDNENWIIVADYPDGIIFGGADGNPLIIRVNNINAQYVKISLYDENVLHLNQVEVYDQ